MKIEKAITIFVDIESGNYSEEEKALAIYEVLNMPTQTSIRKDDMLSVIKWLWFKAYEMVGDTE